MLFWKNLSKNLMNKWVFNLNPYGRYVANKAINGRQCKIIWNVDDLKISHVDSNAVGDIIELSDKEYGQDPETPLTVHFGKMHNYLGMTIHYNTKGKVVFTMFDYIQDVFDEPPEEFHGQTETPAANHLFDVDKESENMNKENGSLFNQLLDKLMYLSKR